VYIAHQLRLPLSWVFGVATFYHFFSLEPQGEHNCIVCMGTACYVKRAAEIVTVLQDQFGIESGETTADRKFSLSEARCLGSCGLAPVLVVDGEVMGRETPESTLEKVIAIVGSNGRLPAGAAAPAKDDAVVVDEAVATKETRA
jgi:bidirectional [NiFe] hydrogenase diaphorase subunit